MRRGFDPMRGAHPCRTCHRLRLFLTVGAGLLIAIYLQPEWAVAAAGLMPPPLWIGMALCAASVIGLALRIRAERARRDLD